LKADLHVHTTASDGTSTPQQVVELAASCGLKAIAITDHDAIGGIEEAIQASCGLGIEVIPGVEINTEHNNREVHILGYFIRYNDEEFQARLIELQNARLIRIEKIVHRLKSLKLPVELSRVLELAGAGSVGRPHIAMVMVEKGYVNSITDAFQQYLGYGASAFIPRYKLDPAEAVGIIRQAGGVAVMAHPGLANCDHLISELVKFGLQGLEVYYPEHSPDMVRRYLSLARNYGLIVTGGSDYHGSGAGYRANLGVVTVSYQVVAQLKKLLSE
jgi:hypothetical protein